MSGTVLICCHAYWLSLAHLSDTFVGEPW